MDRLDEQLENLLCTKKPPSPGGKLLEIPGAGPKIVAAFIDEVEDVTRF